MKNARIHTILKRLSIIMSLAYHIIPYSYVNSRHLIVYFLHCSLCYTSYIHTKKEKQLKNRTKTFEIHIFHLFQSRKPLKPFRTLDYFKLIINL